MKEAEKIIKCSESWFNKDQENRTAVVILIDKKEEGKVWGYLTGTTREIGNLIYSLMTEKKELGYNIYVAACLYAHKYIAAKEHDKINAVISAAAEVRDRMYAAISASVEARKKPKGGEK